MPRPTTRAAQSPASDKPQRHRLSYIDSTRGVAVALMFVWHTAHAWLEPSLQTGPAWRALRLFGGLAAPIFFIMLGAGLQIRLSRRPASLAELRGVLARGAELIAFGYLLRLQFWTIDGPGAHSLPGAATCALLATGYLLAVVGLRRFAGGRPRSTPLFVLSACGVGAGLALSHDLWAAQSWRLLKVDVLQALGLSMIVGGTLRMGVAAVASPAGGAIAGGVAAFACYPLARLFHTAPPPMLSHYLVRLPRPRRVGPKARFPLFPWLSLALGGMVVARTVGRLSERERPLGVAALGLTALATATAIWEGWHYIDALMRAWPVCVQPLRMLFRIAAVSALCAGLWSWHHRQRGGGLERLQRMGRHSLLLYWVHLEIVFGRPSNPLHHRLGFASWGLAVVLLALAMYGLARFDPAARLRRLVRRG